MSITTDKPRVVVADDSALMRCIVSTLLARGGMEVVGAAKDGDEALAMCEREQPDAMTLDLAMPGLGGIDVLRELRQRGGRQIPVVVVSAFSPAHGARAVDALAEGAFELVPKPNGSSDVDAFAQNLLGKITLAIRTRRRLRPWRPPPGGDGHRRPAQDGVARALLIATSTGGPRALATLIPGLPSP